MNTPRTDRRSPRLPDQLPRADETRPVGAQREWTQQPDRWSETGFDPDFASDCTMRGWVLSEVCSVLCADQASEYPTDWFTSGLDPLEVLVAIRDGSTLAPGEYP